VRSPAPIPIPDTIPLASPLRRDFSKLRKSLSYRDKLRRSVTEGRLVTVKFRGRSPLPSPKDALNAAGLKLNLKRAMSPLARNSPMVSPLRHGRRKTPEQEGGITPPGGEATSNSLSSKGSRGSSKGPGSKGSGKGLSRVLSMSAVSPPRSPHPFDMANYERDMSGLSLGSGHDSMDGSGRGSNGRRRSASRASTMETIPSKPDSLLSPANRAAANGSNSEGPATSPDQHRVSPSSQSCSDESSARDLGLGPKGTSANGSFASASATPSPGLDDGGGGRGRDGGDGGSGSAEAVAAQTNLPVKPKPVRAAESKPLFQQCYKLHTKLGFGTFSTVYVAEHIATGKEFAAKCIAKRGLTVHEMFIIEKEVSILRMLNHPQVIELVDFYNENDFYIMVMPLVKGGELFERIVKKTFYSEQEARDVVKSLLEIVNYCHQNNIAHRDLKPENILLTSSDDDTSIMLCDFGVAKKFRGGLRDHNMKTGCGSPHYVAPEIVDGKEYGAKCDIWSLGVIVFTLLCGYLPFDSLNDADLFNKISSGKFRFESPYWDKISAEAKDLIRKILVVDQNARPTAAELLRHEWIRGTEEEVAFAGDLTSTLGDLRKHNERRKKFRVAVTAVRVVNTLRKFSLSESFVPKRDSRGNKDKGTDGEDLTSAMDAARDAARESAAAVELPEEPNSAPTRLC